MLRALTTAATGMIAQQNNLDVISNNVANLSTYGYKKVRAEFEEQEEAKYQEWLKKWNEQEERKKVAE